MSQHRREIFNVKNLEKSNANILVATDVAARGIDIPRVALVIKL